VLDALADRGYCEAKSLGRLQGAPCDQVDVLVDMKSLQSSQFGDRGDYQVRN
jgi:hypothetical protein